ncbi:helix-turn-helix domain-containing protein [Paenibacillus cymbidii]|uniref:helix-turn-helix domain-containing protein n=1 Tax=Paenibacillus cymbidii TaxID=1639034 RepID=UPI00108065D6|nr:helix-turn-helix domain-containing protein [Paenibacillus cymbidii]
MYDDYYDEILTVQEMAELLKIGMNTAYNLINSGEIESFRVGKSHRIQRSAVTDYIISKRSNRNQ